MYCEDSSTITVQDTNGINLLRVLGRLQPIITFVLWRTQKTQLAAHFMVLSFAIVFKAAVLQ